VTDGQNYDSQDRASKAASRGKMLFSLYCKRNRTCSVSGDHKLGKTWKPGILRQFSEPGKL